MICYNCGNDITTQGTNCPFCGSPLSADAGNRPNYNQAQYDNMQQQYNQNQYNQNQYNQNQYSQYGYQQPQSQPMDPKSSAIICYITLIGFIIACICADKNHPFVKSHLNNAAALVISGFISSAACVIPIIGWIFAFVASIFLFVCWLMGLIAAINGEVRELPIIGSIKVFN